MHSGRENALFPSRWDASLSLSNCGHCLVGFGFPEKEEKGENGYTDAVNNEAESAGKL